MNPPELHLVLVICALLIAGIAAAALARAARLTPIVGYLAAGALIGPYGLALVPEGETLRFLAELGVVFLLFDIGMHFSLKSLWQTRKQLFGLGPLQILLAAIPLAALTWPLSGRLEVALIIGATLALSSTAVVLQHLAERGEQGTPLGRAVTAVLIFQDLAAVFLLALLGTLSGTSGAPLTLIGLTLLKAVAAIVAVAVLGRLIRPLFTWITQAGNEEAFVATALLLVLATAGATAAAGLSMPLGAFLAGMALSESEYCYRVKTELRPFRGLLLGLFFVTVGMALEIQVLGERPWALAGLLAGLVLFKALTATVAALVLRQSPGFALRLGFALAQGSEFAFVVFSLAASGGLISEDLSALLSAAVVFSMALTAGLVPLGERLGEQLESRLGRSAPAPVPQPPRHQGRVLLNGMNEASRTVARALHAQGINYIALEPDPKRLVRARAEGFAVAFGNPWERSLLESAGLSEAQAVVLGEAGDARAVTLVKQLRERYPKTQILVRALDEDTAAALKQAGATVCIGPEDPDPITLATQTLRHLGVPEADIGRWRDEFAPSEWARADKLHQTL